MAEDSDLEKTEPASPKRIEKAREEGDVPRSRELATLTVLLAAGLSMLMMSEHLNQSLKTSMSEGLRFDRAMAYDPILLLMKIASNIYELTLAFSPLAIILMIVAIGSPALIGGWNFSEKALVPKFSKMNPLQGISNMFSKNSAIELVKSVAKTFLVGTVAYMVVSNDMEAILSLSLLPVAAGISQMGDLLLFGFLSIVSALVLIAAIDVPFQLYNYAEKLKMTKEEVKQESKESEGNPEIKARIRQQQREMARRRMMSEIPNADVVITNPTHYAVAIKYKEDGMRAPVVVAKGADAVALKIREIAAENNVLTIESPKLARAIFTHTELNAEIPEALFSAVAEVLAYVFQMRIFKKDGGLRPEIPNALPVPDVLDPHSLMPAPSMINNAADEDANELGVLA
ncbi:MAG: flagellar biosynthesis protein FlhB [Methylotenera sp.]|nr:flagellar biosynthesis protein FlhB [Methylotenera sp.]MDO9232739.1 flagellar biosynthesis protein FlhB [Methylotenera sp.]MDO9389865.1 flagellar biosynthesis protein FlhB [Methylotenera sp.]MDP2102463.1 flagellar biosynthesis protein FlhB [Methylotenera sp.]MDP2281872.1 flagellar biosynthesis protein FlhB [Methylotenera sp.]